MAAGSGIGAHVHYVMPGLDPGISLATPMLE